LVQIVKNGRIVLDDGPLEGSGQDCELNEPGTYTYRLVASNSVGQSDEEQRTVTVTEGTPDNPLAGTSWTVTGYNNGTGAVVPVLDGTVLTALFDAEGSVNGSGGCNNYSGPYSVDGSALLIGPLTYTQLACDTPEGVMQQESAFFTALQTAATYEVVDDQLTVKDDSGATAITATPLLVAQPR
jgi:heat shock protein HslJ